MSPTRDSLIFDSGNMFSWAMTDKVSGEEEPAAPAQSLSSGAAHQLGNKGSTALHGGKEGKKKVDIHVEIEKPDIKGKLKDVKNVAKDKAVAAKAQVEKKLTALKGMPCT
jgi:hypothetical protein